MLRPTVTALLLTLFLPSAIYVAFAAPSMSAGLLICAIFWILIGVWWGISPFTFPKSDLHRFVFLIVAIALLFIHVVITSVRVGNVDFTRFYSSCALLVLVFIGAQVASARLLRAPAAHLVRMADIALVVLTALGLAAVFGVPAVGPQATPKAVIIFSEPSLFGCAYMPVLLFRIAVSSRKRQLALLAIALLLAVLLQSLTMIASTLIVSALLLRRAALFTMIVGVAIGLGVLDLAYYTDRLNFTSETENISTLVFLQGWENAILDFQATSGFGVGFQQFGIVGPIGDFADRVSGLVGDYINLLDGGSMATKLVAEFGAMGVLATIVYMIVATRCALFIRKAQGLRHPRDTHKIFFFSLIVTYSFELFLRGSGYFTPGGFLMLTALISVYGKHLPEAPKKDARHNRPTLAASS